jgi:hypothetical protein
MKLSQYDLKVYCLYVLMLKKKTKKPQRTILDK